MKPLAAFVAALTFGVVADVVRADLRARLRAEECPACEGSGGTLLDDWGYEREDCRVCGGTGLRAGAA